MKLSPINNNTTNNRPNFGANIVKTQELKEYLAKKCGRTDLDAICDTFSKQTAQYNDTLEFHGFALFSPKCISINDRGYLFNNDSAFISLMQETPEEIARILSKVLEIKKRGEEISKLVSESIDKLKKHTDLDWDIRLCGDKEIADQIDTYEYKSFAKDKELKKLFDTAYPDWIFFKRRNRY